LQRNRYLENLLEANVIIIKKKFGGQKSKIIFKGLASQKFY
jgi:hypothetical protein